MIGLPFVVEIWYNRGLLYPRRMLCPLKGLTKKLQRPDEPITLMYAIWISLDATSDPHKLCDCKKESMPFKVVNPRYKIEGQR